MSLKRYNIQNIFWLQWDNTTNSKTKLISTKSYLLYNKIGQTDKIWKTDGDNISSAQNVIDWLMIFISSVESKIYISMKTSYSKRK